MSPEQTRMLQLVIWMVLNIVSVTLAAKDMRDAGRVRNFVRSHYRSREDITETDRLIVYRSRRLALHRMAMALVFLLAGLDAVLSRLGVIPQLGLVAWFLIVAAAILTVDVIYESRYRKYMFANRSVDL